MEVNVKFVRFCLLPLLSFLSPARAGGTLNISLERYQNDTCGGYSHKNGECVYHVTLTIQYLVPRGGDTVEDTKRHKLSQLRSNKFPDNLGPVANPVPIRYIKGGVNFTFAVNNSIERIFETTLAFDADLMMPRTEDQFYDDYNETGFLAFSTSLTCDPHSTGVGCQECEEGWHGAKCEVWCEPNRNHSCQPDTGAKVCKEQHYSEECDKYCADTSLYSCTEHGNKLCVYPAIGEDCATISSCPEHQYEVGCNVTCHPLPGHYICGVDGSRVCEGNFAGADCTTCTDYHYGTDCNITCEPRAPRYTCNDSGERVCGTGWKGAQCAQCADSWFGEQCEVECNITSTRYTCSNSGSKICLYPNMRGRECECSRNYYGPLCQVYCEDNPDRWRCDRNTGEKICIHHRTGEDCSSCKEDYYTVGHSAKCVHCIESDRYTCTNGKVKKCKEPWYGAECDVHCEESARYTCHSNGTIRCKAKFKGENCESCIDDYYGESCNVICRATELTECDPETGAVKCRENYFTLEGTNQTCARFCNTSSPHYTCDSEGNTVCKVKTRDPVTQCETCNAGWYGAQCETYCNTVHPNKQCSPDGALVCKVGFAGEACEECAENYYNWLCNDEEVEEGTCDRTCDMYCVDTAHFTCGSDGVHEMVQEHSQEYYSAFSDFYDDKYSALKIAAIVSGFALVYLLATVILYYSCFVWYPPPGPR